MELGEKRGMELGEKRGMELGEKRGMELGEKRGMELGATTERLNLARRMIATKMPLEQIASYTLLPLDRLRELSKSYVSDDTENKPRR
jgi:predicted transposase YdaD